MNKKISFLILFGVLISFNFVHAADCYTFSGNNKLNKDTTLHYDSKTPSSADDFYFASLGNGFWQAYDSNGNKVNGAGGIYSDSQLENEFGFSKEDIKKTNDAKKNPSVTVISKPVSPEAKTSSGGKTAATAPVKTIPDELKDVITTKEGKYYYGGDEVELKKGSDGSWTATYSEDSKKGTTAYYFRDLTKTSSGENINVRCTGGAEDCSFSTYASDPKTKKRDYDSIPELSGNFEKQNDGSFKTEDGATVKLTSSGLTYTSEDGAKIIKTTKDGFEVSKYDVNNNDGEKLTSQTTYYKPNADGTQNRGFAEIEDGDVKYTNVRNEDGRNIAYDIDGKTYNRISNGDTFCLKGSDCSKKENIKTLDDLANLAKDGAEKLKSEESKNNILTGNSWLAEPGKFFKGVEGIYGNISGNQYWLDKWGWSTSAWAEDLADNFARSVFSEERFAGKTWCSEWFGDEGAPVTIVPGAGGTAAGHIEGRRAEGYYEENGNPKMTYIYTITLSVDPSKLMKSSQDYLSFKVVLQPGNKVLKIDKKNELITIKADSDAYSRDGSNAIQQNVEKYYETVCLDFSSSFDKFTAEVRSLMHDDPLLCNNFMGDVAKQTDETGIFGFGVPDGTNSGASSGSSSGGESGGTGEGASSGETRPDTVNPQGVQDDFE